jgi:4-amino-4-deoxy-L-arabinose transferase-like glycosyltransferase
MGRSFMSSMQEMESQSIPRYAAAALLVVLLLTAALRLYKLGQSPPGLNQDEAVNAWNAYCLLKTGTDQHGVSWPIFYMRAFGGNNSPLYIYTLIPFQAIGGMNIYTTRLPGVFAGVLTVFLIYFTGKRLFNWQVGLIAAAFLAIDPWNLQQSRWGHEAGLAALAGLVPLATLLWARMPITNSGSQSPLPLRAAAAGALTGIVCYGYHAIRIFVPVFLLAIFAATLTAWWNQLKTRKGLFGIAAYAAGLSATFGPLVYQHIFHPEGIGRHAMYNKLWTGSETLGFKIQTLVNRYIGHFGPDFLFMHGDPFVIQSPPGMGMFYWYMMPLMIIGLAVVIYRFRSSYCARLLLVYVLVYPTGDVFFQMTGMHALRSFPGSCSLVLLAAAGAFFAADWLLKKSRQLALSLVVLFVIVAVYFNLQYLHRFYGDYNLRSDVYHYLHVDLLDALDWLKPRLKDTDLVFCTTENLNMPYVISLVALDYDPRKWFAQPPDYLSPGGKNEWDYCTHYDRMYFMYDSSFISAIESARPDTTLYFIIRPGQLPLEPVYRVYRPEGVEALDVCAVLRSAFATNK